jgi:hypothetical protein
MFSNADIPSINCLTLETCLTLMGENPDVKDKNRPTAIATCENIVAISK